MAIPFTTLPVVEKWDCHSCGICCRGHTVFLEEEDLKLLEQQRWAEHPEFRDRPVTMAVGLFDRRLALAQQGDGSCVFLQSDGLCKVHSEFGEAAKPWACRMYPFQLLPVGDSVRLTMRRSCPSAARDLGRPLIEHNEHLQSLADRALPKNLKVSTPRITPRVRKEWPETLQVAEFFERIVLNQGLPVVRRLVHGLMLCDHLERAKLNRLDSRQLKELLELFYQSVADDTEPLFSHLEQPSSVARVLFRQSAAEYVRLHPNFADRPGWATRVKMLFSALKFVRGKGQIPRIHPDFPIVNFEDLEQPLGHLSPEVAGPINRYIEAATSSFQYCGAGRFGWSVVDGFRALALSYAVGCWMLRWLATDQVPTADNAVQVVCTSDRSHYYPLLGGIRHLKRVRTLARDQQLHRTLIWYAR